MGIYINTQYGDLGEDLSDFFQENNIKTCFDYDPPDEKGLCILAVVLLNNKKYVINSKGSSATSGHKHFKDIENTMNDIEQQYDLPIISVLHKNDNDLIDSLASINILGTTKFQFKTNMKIYGTLSSLMNLENDVETNPSSGYASLWKAEIYKILSGVFIKHKRD